LIPGFDSSLKMVRFLADKHFFQKAHDDTIIFVSKDGRQHRSRPLPCR
jgi:hypothetical protein